MSGDNTVLSLTGGDPTPNEALEIAADDIASDVLPRSEADESQEQGADQQGSSPSPAEANLLNQPVGLRHASN